MATKFRFKNADGTTVDFEDYYVRADYFRSGNAWICGDGSYGGIGDNTATGKSSPVQTIAFGSNWKQVSADNNWHVTGVKTDGTLWTWGFNGRGQLGDNTTTDKSSPIQTVTRGTNWVQVSQGYSFTGAIKTDGTLWLWGSNYNGELGDNTVALKSSPVQTIARGNNWKQVACGTGTCLAVKTDGTLWGCGSGTYGNLGTNDTLLYSSPVQTVAYGTNWKQVSANVYHTAAVKTDGTLWMWGYNYYGNLGDNTQVDKSSPVQTVAGGTNWKQVSCGNFHTAAIKTDGTLWSWGDNLYGELGENIAYTKYSSPVQTIAYGTNWKQVSCGLYFTTAVKTDGTLWAWGLNNYGNLGTNEINVNYSSPVQTVMYGTNWKQVSCGYYKMIAVQYQDEYQ